MASTTEPQFADLRNRYGDHLSPDEALAVYSIRHEFASVLQARRCFLSAIINSAVNLVKITTERGGILNFDVMNLHRFMNDATTVQSLERLAESTNESPLTVKEESFARDVIGAIDFVLENGIGFGLIANCLSHDFLEVLQVNGMEQAIFNPKVSGWASYNKNEVGDSLLDD